MKLLAPLLSARPAAVTRLAGSVRMVHTEKRLADLGITLPPPGTPKANYTVANWESPTLLYMSGHLPIRLDGTMVTGAIGPGGRSLEDGQELVQVANVGCAPSLANGRGAQHIFRGRQVGKDDGPQLARHLAEGGDVRGRGVGRRLELHGSCSRAVPQPWAIAL